MNTKTTLPLLGQPMETGTFVGLTTRPDGTHCAVVLLPSEAEKLRWPDAVKWAEEQGGELPSRPVAALLFANAKDQFKQAWYWTGEEDGSSCAWNQRFNYGYQFNDDKSAQLRARAVRRFPLSA
jgi:hypothetical protein